MNRVKVVRTNIITHDDDETLISCMIIRTTSKYIITTNVDNEEIYLFRGKVEIISQTASGLAEISVPNWLAMLVGVL